MFKKYVYLCLITIFLLLNSSLAVAQPNEIEITSLETQIMPEYDTADILIVNSIKFTNKSNNDFTGEFKWRLPKGSLKQIVTENTNGNNHLQANIVPGQGYDEMVWKLPNPLKPGEIKEIHLEFYYNNLQGNPDKKFTYDFKPTYPVISATMLLLQPTKASNLKITPEFGQPTSNQGWTYYTKSLNNIAKDQVTNITVAYTKSDPSPSVVPGQQQTGQTQNNGTNKSSASNDKVIIFAAASIAIVIVIAIAYSRIQRNNREDDEFDDNEKNEELEDYEEDEELEESPKSKVLESKKKELRRKLEEGLITDVDYYEAVMELEDEAKKF